MNARRVARRLRSKACTLEVSPERGRLIPELQRFGIRAFRGLLVGPYRLMYRVTQDCVFVIAVFDGRRTIEEVLFQRLLKDPT